MGQQQTELADKLAQLQRARVSYAAEPNRATSRTLAARLIRVANALARADQIPDAIATGLEAIDVLAELVEDPNPHPPDDLLHVSLAVEHRLVSGWYGDCADDEAALSHSRRCLDIAQGFTPASARDAVMVANALLFVAQLLAERDESESALLAVRGSAAMGRAAVESGDDSAETRRCWRGALLLEGLILWRDGSHAEALDALDHLQDVLDQERDSQLATLDARTERFWVMSSRANLHQVLGHRLQAAGIGHRAERSAMTLLDDLRAAGRHQEAAAVKQGVTQPLRSLPAFIRTPVEDAL